MIRPTRKGSVTRLALTRTDAPSCVPTTVTRLALTGTDAQIVRPYNRYSSRFNGDGRTDRASLQPLLVSQYYNGRSIVRPYNRYTSRCTTAVTRLERPAKVWRASKLCTFVQISPFLYG